MTFTKINELAISELLDFGEVTQEIVHAVVCEYSTLYELDNYETSKLHRNLMTLEGA